MARLFLSHSSAGERWERALSEAANRCEAVLFLVSRNWLASAWCLKEFHLAARLNKRMFGVLVEDVATGAPSAPSIGHPELRPLRCSAES